MDIGSGGFRIGILNEAGYDRFHAVYIQPSDGNNLHPVRAFRFRDVALEADDNLEGLKAKTQAFDWLHFSGKGLMLELLFRLE